MTLELVWLLFAPVVYVLGWRLGQARWRTMETDAALSRAVVDSAPDVAVMVHDQSDSGRVVYANAEACRQLGVDLATLLTWTPARWDPNHAAETDAVPDGRPCRYEAEHLGADGERIPVEVSLSRLDLPGRDYLLRHARDLRPQRAMEARALKLERRALEMRLERGYKEVYDNLLDAVFLFDVAPSGRIVVAGCNRRAETLIGLAEADALGRVKAEVFPAELAERLEALDTLCVASGTPVHDHDLAALPVGMRHLDIALVPLLHPDGRVHRVIAILRDVTERERRESREAARGEVFNLLSSGAELAEVLAKVVAFAESSRPGLHAAIQLPDPAGVRLEPVVAPGRPGCLAGPHVRVRIAETGCACGVAAHGKAPMWVADLGENPCHSACAAMARGGGAAACWVMPIVDSADVLLGAFGFFQDRPGLPDAADRATMEQACQMARLVIERRRTEARIRHQADYDMLTGLPNRGLLRGRLAGMLSRVERLALLYIDLDNFKEINDSLGHHLGDQMLEEAAHRLRDAVPHGDLVARMSGDEFVAVISDADRAEAVAERVRQALSGDYALGQGRVWATASIGIALFPDHGRGLDELLGQADQALFAAKAAGRDCLRVFDQTMRDKTQLRVRLGNDLRAALEAGQLSLHYQPIVEIDDGRVAKAEALLRWNHPELGMVSPAMFVPIAEETGLIHEIGDWVFREAARVALAWNQLSWETDASLRRISINRSPRQFFSRDGVDHWLAWLRFNGIPGNILGVEITEGLLLDDRPEVTRQLSALRGEGIAISLDDFGTGYSALSYLKKFAIDYLKLDRSFILDVVSDRSSRAIVESIVAMTGRLDMGLIAEGVEEPKQAEILAAAGCRLAQGYLYARPMPEAEFLAFVGAETPVRQGELEFDVGR